MWWELGDIQCCEEKTANQKRINEVKSPEFPAGVFIHADVFLH